ncbi:MAG: VanZ family protein [Prevotella sp.]|nr:VanZ family protein [Prevotella sp.]
MDKFFEKLKSFRKDDWMHFTVSLLLCFALSSAAQAFFCTASRGNMLVAVVAFVATMAMGFYKELFIDERVSLADLLADVLGAVVGATMSVI